MCSRSTSPTKRDTLRLRCAACTRVHAAVSLSRVMVTFFIGWLDWRFPLGGHITLVSCIYASYGSSDPRRSEEHTSELQSHSDLVCRLLLEKKKTIKISVNLEHYPIL